jgi:hypothetical protein
LHHKQGENMNGDETAIAAWAARNLPGRLNVTHTAKLLGIAEHDIPILMHTRKLTPLGAPAPNAPKYFAAVEVIQHATDKDWLHKATHDLARYWREKRARRSTPSNFGTKQAQNSPLPAPSPASPPTFRP